MKDLLLVTILLLPVMAIGQKQTISISIDSTIKEIDKLSKRQIVYYDRTTQFHQKKIIEKWQHFNNGLVSFINIEYKIDSIVYQEKYYFKEKLLIYAYESEITYFPHLGKKEYSAWAGDFYFSNGKLVDYVTLGHGKSEIESWDTEKEIKQRLKRRKAELLRLK